jgi:hypothetical protein
MIFELKRGPFMILAVFNSISLIVYISFLTFEVLVAYLSLVPVPQTIFNLSSSVLIQDKYRVGKRIYYSQCRQARNNRRV